MIGSVVERASSSRKPPVLGSFPAPDPSTGYPAVTHRSKATRGTSAFAKNRTANPARAENVPTILPAISLTAKWEPAEDHDESAVLNEPTPTLPKDVGKMLQEAGEENERRIAEMTEDERLAEREELLEKFGSGIGEMLRRRRLQREGKPVEDNGREPRLASASGSGISPPPTRIFNKSRDVKEHTSSTLEEYPSPVAMQVERIEPPTTPPSRAKLLEELDRPRSALRDTTEHSETSSTIRRLRFADVTPSDIHVYPSQPSSPKPMHLLMPPAADGTDDGVPVTQLRFRSLRPEGTRKHGSGPSVWLADQSTSQQQPPIKANAEAEEGTPEDIRRRFFPNEGAAQPGLEWITAPSGAESSDAPRFDLQGALIPRSLQNTLPTHLGLHHTASSLAGYTLDDLLYLSRSTNAAQRSTVLSVLARVVHRLGRGEISVADLGLDARERIMKSGLAALGEKGSVGARAVDVVWEAVVGWDESYVLLEGIELWTEEKRRVPSPDDDAEPPTIVPGMDVLSAIPLEPVLPLVQAYFTVPPSFPSVTLSQLLGILHQLASQYVVHASTIISAPNFLSSILSAWLSYKPSDFPGDIAQDSKLISLLSVLAASSRSNAEALTADVPNVLLRFIAQPPHTSQPAEERELRETLMAETLHFYATLARYGFSSKTALTVQEFMSGLVTYLSSSLSEGDITPSFARLVETFLEVREVWTVCATDPHKTSPPHELIWSQIEAFAWVDDLLHLADHIPEDQETMWTALWNATAAYAEGSMINGIKGGEAERKKVLDSIEETVQSGRGRTAMDSALEDLSASLDQYDGLGKPRYFQSLRNIARPASLLGGAMRLSVSLIAAPTSTSDPLGLPSASLSRLMDGLLDSTIWTDALHLTAPPGAYLYLRPLTSLLMSELKLSYRLGTMSMESWSVRALRVLRRLLPGDEAHAEWIIEKFAAGVQHLADGMEITIEPAILQRRVLEDVKPFYLHAVRPDMTIWIAPSTATAESLAKATRLILPALAGLHKGPTSTLKALVGLPFKRDWLFQPINDLLRSSTSNAFESFPPSWDASETEVGRATLLGVEMYQELLHASHPDEALSREEMIFGCMKVFMLEHGQPQQDSSEDVFRDVIVSKQMRSLLDPFAISSSATLSDTPYAPPSSEDGPPLEVVSKEYLGSGTPFYQFYTDFVALYEAISFADSTFARLLLPPISQRYPPDYRKLFWGDYSVAIRTIRTPVESVLAESVDEYLWPVESDAELLSRYVRALVTQTAQGFLRLIALHHVACSIWSTRDGEETKRRHLLMAFLRQTRREIVADVLMYELPTTRPAYLDLLGRQARLDWVKSWGGADLMERLQSSVSTGDTVTA